MSGPELVVLFADADAERFVSTLIGRGIERKCLRPFAWKAVRDPMRDARVAREPLASLATFLPTPHLRFLVLFDHHGSGRDDEPAAATEQYALDVFARAGIAQERVAVVAFVPELESVLGPAWERVLEILARKRQEEPRRVAFRSDDPKAALAEATAAHRLKPDAALFEELAEGLSLPKLKEGPALARLAERLLSWFGAG